MPSTYTPSLQLENIAYGEASETWGTKEEVNRRKLDRAIAGWLTISLAGATSPYTLSFTQGSTDEASYSALEFTGSTGASFTVVLPTVSKLWYVKNSTPNNIVLSMGTASFTVPTTARMAIWSDGSTLQDHLTRLASLDVTGALTASSATFSNALALASGGTAGTTQDTAAANTTKVSMVSIYPGASAPTGWLLADGSAVSRTTYAALYAALGSGSSTWGQGDGATTFNVPTATGLPTLTGFCWVIKT